MFERKLIWIAFGTERDKTKIQNNNIKIDYLCDSHVIIKVGKVRWSGNVTQLGRQGMHWVLMRSPTGRWNKCEVNIKMYSKETVTAAGGWN